MNEKPFLPEFSFKDIGNSSTLISFLVLTVKTYITTPHYDVQTT